VVVYYGRRYCFYIDCCIPAVFQRAQEVDVSINVYGRIVSWRRVLNTLLILVVVCEWVIPSAILALLLMFMVALPFQFALLFPLLGGLLAIVYGWRRRLDTRATGRWLDERSAGQGCFSAVLEGRGRQWNGRFDVAILKIATSRFPYLKGVIRKPLWHLGKRLSAACLTCLLLALPVWLPAEVVPVGDGLTASQKNGSYTAPETFGQQSLAMNNQPVDIDPGKNTTLDQELARLAEQAGSTLVNRERYDQDARSVQESLAKNRVQQERPETSDSSQNGSSTSNAGQDEDTGADEDNAGGGSKNPAKKPDGGSDGQDDENSVGGGKDDEKRPDLNNDGTPDDNQDGSGKEGEYHDGKGVLTDWGNVKGKAGSSLLDLFKRNGVPGFAYLVPEKSRTVTDSSTAGIVQSNTTGGLATFRKTLPPEYREFLEAYYQELNKTNGQ